MLKSPDERWRDIGSHTADAIQFVSACTAIVLVATAISFSWCVSDYLTNKAAFENGYEQRHEPGSHLWYWEKKAEAE